MISEVTMKYSMLRAPSAAITMKIFLDIPMPLVMRFHVRTPPIVESPYVDYESSSAHFHESEHRTRSSFFDDAEDLPTHLVLPGPL